MESAAAPVPFDFSLHPLDWAVILVYLVGIVLLGVLWKRFTPAAAFWTLVLGSAALLVSLFVPALIAPLAHGEPLDPADPTWRHYSYMRSLFGLMVSGALGVTISFCTRPKADGELSGLVMSSIHDAMRRFKGGEPNERRAGVSVVLPIQTDSVAPGTVRLPQAVMIALAAEPGDLLYVSDDRWWLGGLRSVHVRAAEPHADECLKLSAADVERGQLNLTRPARVEKLM